RFEGSLSGPVLGNLTFFLGGTLEGQKGAFRGIGADTVPTYVMGGLDTTVAIPNGLDTSVVEIPRFVQFSGECDAQANAGFACQGRRLPYDWQTSATANAKLQ
ncbi:MAG: hypothetical protein GTO05_02330, partial [Gemmatimonadales bacterium]|nr:hypothetical protein [Gemmatimonadales bacterium]